MRRRPRLTTGDPSDDERQHEMASLIVIDEPKCGIRQIDLETEIGEVLKATASDQD